LNRIITKLQNIFHKKNNKTKSPIMSMLDVICGPNTLPEHRADGNMHGEVREHRGWSPYMDNGGTVASACGEDYAVITSDTRMSKGYSICTRNRSKCTKLTETCVIASAGMQSDALTLHIILKIRIANYVHSHRKEPSITAIAQMLSTMLYHKRFFPYYTFNVLAGIDSEGRGASYHYDAIGSFERVPYSTSGSGSSMVLSVLDQHLQGYNIVDKSPAKPAYDHEKHCSKKSKEDMAQLMTDVIHSVAERDIYTGDHYECFVIDATGVHHTTGDLKKD